MIVLCGAKTRDIEGIKITVLDVGQGDGIVLSGKGKNYLIDGGSSDVKQAGAQRSNRICCRRASDALIMYL